MMRGNWRREREGVMDETNFKKSPFCKRLCSMFLITKEEKEKALPTPVDSRGKRRRPCLGSLGSSLLSCLVEKGGGVGLQNSPCSTLTGRRRDGHSKQHVERSRHFREKTCAGYCGSACVLDQYEINSQSNQKPHPPGSSSRERSENELTNDRGPLGRTVGRGSRG